MINYEKVASKIFSTIKGHGHDLVMFTDEGMETSDAEEARRFFVSKPNYMVTLDGEARHIKINKNSNVKLEDMESIMKQLKNLATSNMLKTEIRVFGKEITPKDFAYQAKNLKEPAMENIQEASFSRMHGFKKTSYQTLESTKIVVRHRRPVEEEVQGSRARNIQAIFIERAGERFRFPHNNLAGARAMARHINEGGDMHDPIGKYIVESISNYNKLMEFMRYARTNKLINEDSEDIVKTVKESMGVIRREIGKLQGAKTYGEMKEHIASSDLNVIEEEGEDTSELQDMFTVRKFDEKIGDVLPIVKKLMDNKQAWRDALVEASKKDIFISETSSISETDIYEFDSPTQRMGYQVRDIADRMIGESDLQTFVGKVAGKLIEGEKISAFEKKVVGNVLGNAVIKEEEEICEGCGEIHEDCKCGPKDVVDLISDSFELKMKMLEHEDIFTEDSDDPSAMECPNCKEIAFVSKGVTGDIEEFECERCKHYGTFDALSEENYRDLDYRGHPLRKLGSKTLARKLVPGLGKREADQRAEDNFFTGRTFRDAEYLSSTGEGPEWEPSPEEARERDRAFKQMHRYSRIAQGKNPFKEADDHAGEVEAGAHSGMPSDDFNVNTTDISELADMVIDDLAGDFDDPDMILRAVTHLVGSDDPAVDDIYQEVLDKINFQDYDDGQPSEYEEWQDYMGGDDWDHGQYDESINEASLSNADRIQRLLDKGIKVVSNVMGMAGEITKIDDGLALVHHKASRRKGWANVNGDDKVLQPHRYDKNAFELVSTYEHEVEEGKYTGFGDVAPNKAERDPCPHCKGTGEPQDPSGWDDLDDLGLCMMCDGSGKVPYIKGSKQDPFGGNYGVDPEDFMDDSILDEAGEQLYNVWRYTSGNEGASGYELELKKVPLAQAKEFLQNEVENAMTPYDDEDFEAEIGEPKQKAHYDGAVIIRQTIDWNDMRERYSGYGGMRDFSHTYYIGPAYWHPRKG